MAMPTPRESPEFAGTRAFVCHGHGRAGRLYIPMSALRVARVITGSKNSGRASLDNLRSIIETVRRYPSGLTEAVILAELELLWRRDVRGAFVPGKLQAYLDAQYAPLSDVIQTCVIRHVDQLVTLAEDHSGSISHEQSPAMVDMYLHQNFKSCLQHVQSAGHDLLASGRKVRLTGCRMLTGATVQTSSGAGDRDRERGSSRARRRSSDASGSTLILTEYLAFVLDHRRSDDVLLAASALGETPVRETFNESANSNPFFVMCKVIDIRPRRQHQDRGPYPARKRRLMLQTIVLQCAAAGRERRNRNSRDRVGGTDENVGGDRDDYPGGAKGGAETVLLHLWDEQTCLASLFRKGDGLAIFWPWLVQSDGYDTPLGGGGGGAATVGGGASGGGSLPSQQSFGIPSQVGAAAASRALGWHYEYGSATAFFVLPRDSRGHFFAVANGVEGIAGTKGATTAMSDGGALTTALGGGLDKPRTGVGVRAMDMPADENGVRDLLQTFHVIHRLSLYDFLLATYPMRLSVADLAPDMSNVSIYGQVISVSVRDATLPIALRHPTTASSVSGMQHASFLEPQSRSLLSQHQQDQRRQHQTASGSHDPRGGDTRVVELGIRDAGGEARIFCCGRDAALDALRSRPGHFVLACGLHTFASGCLTSETSSQQRKPGADFLILCGDPEDAARIRPTAGEGDGAGIIDALPMGFSVIGGGAGDGACRILNASCLEGLLQCPFLSRHSLLHDRRRAPGPRATVPCKVAVTWARWAGGGESGLWAIHRRCQARLPCHYNALQLGSRMESTRQTGRKRSREIREPGKAGSKAGDTHLDATVTCELCKATVRVARAEEAELGYAPLLLALDDGSRCIFAECRGDVVAVALGGMHAHVFLHLSPSERTATLASLVGRELRCVVGSNSGWKGSDQSVGASRDVSEGCLDEIEGNWDTSGVEYRVEAIASANPAADLAYLLAQ